MNKKSLSIIGIISGLVLVFLQLLSVAGYIKAGHARFPSLPTSSAQLLFDIVYLGSYYAIGILGVILVVLSLFLRYRKDKIKEVNYYNKTVLVNRLVAVFCIVSAVLVVLVMNIQDADRDRLESIPPSALYVFMLVANIVCVVLLSIMKKRTLRSKTKVVFYVIIITLCLAVGSFEFYDSSIWAVRNSSYLTYRTYLSSNFVTVLNHVICILNIVVVLAFALSKAVPYLKEHKLSMASYRSSIAYKEKCYAKVSKMYDYYQKGIISEEEYEKNKQEILKNINN